MKKNKSFIQQFKFAFNKEEVISELPLILEDIYALLEQIKKSKNEKEAEIYFITLGEIQGILAILTFEHNVHLPQELRKILRDCDRLDDKDVRDFLFREIKNGTYCLKSDKFLWY